MNVRTPSYGSGVKRGKTLAINFPVDDAVLAQIQALAEEREWTVNHVLRKIVPLGLEVYLTQTTLPHPLELSGKEVQQ